MIYDFELWATLPEMESKHLEEEDVSVMKEIDIDDADGDKIIELLVDCGGETSEEMVAERMPQLHHQLRSCSENEAKKALALRLVQNKCYEVDIDDFFEEDLRNGIFKYVKPDDVDGDIDEEEGYVDALFAWKDWEWNRLIEMDAMDCVDYLIKRYQLKLDTSELDFGYFLPDELAAEAISKMMNQ